MRCFNEKYCLAPIKQVDVKIILPFSFSLSQGQCYWVLMIQRLSDFMSEKSEKNTQE